MTATKSSCQHCGQHIEHPEDMVGQQFICPSCGRRTTLNGNPTGPQRMSTCPDCREAVSKKALQCPHCGRVLVKRRSVFFYVFTGTLSLIATALILLFLAGVFGAGITGFLKGLRASSPTPPTQSNVIGLTKTDPPLPELFPPLAGPEEALYGPALAKLKKDRDEVEGITWYEMERPAHTTGLTYVWPELYIGKKDGRRPSLRLRVWYQGWRWLFVKQLKFKNASGRYELTVGEDVRRKVISADKLWETIDTPVSDQLEFITNLVASTDGILRLEGSESSEDHLITSREIEAMRDVLLVYRGLLHQK